MTDLISREAALKAVSWDTEAYMVINNLPSAQPELVIPHRNYKYLSDYWCKCGWHLGKMGDVNYCPNCGKRVQWDE